MGRKMSIIPVSNAVGTSQVNLYPNVFPTLFFQAEAKSSDHVGAEGKHSVSLSLVSFHLFPDLLHISPAVVILRTLWTRTHFFSSASYFLLLNFHFPTPKWEKCLSWLILKFITESPLLKGYHVLGGWVAFHWWVDKLEQQQQVAWPGPFDRMYLQV